MRPYLATLIVLTIATGQVSAQETAAIPPPRAFTLPPRVGIAGERPLTLQEVLAMALANNRDIDIARIDQQRAGYNVIAALGVYDPRVGGVGSFQKNVSPVSSALGGSSTGAVVNKNFTLDPQLSGAVQAFGSSYAMDLSSQRTTTNNSFATLNPQFPSALTFSYTQPLWRGLRYDDNRRRIDVAKKNQSLTDAQFRQRVMDVVTRAEQAYWDLSFAYNNLAVQLEAVQIAWDQDGSNRRQQAQGLLAAIDIVAGQRQMATFEQAAFAAQEVLTAAENGLKAMILAERDDPLWSLAIVPSTPVNVSTPVVPLREAIAEALASRPELAQLRITREINQADNKLLLEQVKPQIDAVLTHSNAGLAGTQLAAAPNPFTSGLTSLSDRINELSLKAGLLPLPSSGGGATGGVPPLLVGGYGTSLGNLFSGNFPTTQVQVRISLPLHNRTAQANLASNVAEARRIRDQQQQAELSIEATVRNTMQSVESAKARLASATVARATAEAQHESEQRQFRAGTSTLFLVQQRQTDMIAARSQERRAQADLGKAIAAFNLAASRTLDQRNIDLR
jgi:outer membrane protein TolC